MSRKKLIVIGGGAAGFFCAVNAARLNRNLDVIILEKTSKLLSKVRISGGGRCNVTHALFDIAEMSKRYPRGQNFVKKSFYQFFTTDTIQWFTDRGVQIKREDDGRMFPVTDSSESIITCLMAEANKYGVEIRLNTEVKEISFNSTESAGSKNFYLTLSDSRHLTSDYLCIATGGYPKSAMFEWIKQLSHSITEPIPSLFTFNLPQHPITKLMGVSTERARVKIEATKLVEEGPLLITHWGLSGPVVLRLSAWGASELNQKGYDFKAHINWLTEYNDQTLKTEIQQIRKQHPVQKIFNHKFPSLPNRLWHFLLEESGVKDDMRWTDLPAKIENTLIRNLVDYVVDVKGKTTFKEEFVTAGGINVSEIDANTMMSRKIANLFFAGEVMDIDGITGGFNFQHAWTSGWIAAKTIASLSSKK